MEIEKWIGLNLTLSFHPLDRYQCYVQRLILTRHRILSHPGLLFSANNTGWDTRALRRSKLPSPEHRVLSRRRWSRFCIGRTRL